MRLGEGGAALGDPLVDVDHEHAAIPHSGQEPLDALSPRLALTSLWGTHDGGTADLRDDQRRDHQPHSPRS